MEFFIVSGDSMFRIPTLNKGDVLSDSNRKSPGGAAYILFTAGARDEVHHVSSTASAERLYGISLANNRRGEFCHLAGG